MSSIIRLISPTRLSLRLSLLLTFSTGLAWVLHGVIFDHGQVHASPNVTFSPALSHRFDRPIALTQPMKSSADAPLEGALIAEQGGRISRVHRGEVTTLIDLSSRVRTRHNEEGLLGLAHAPNFSRDPRIFVYYSASKPRRSVIAELTLNKDHSKVLGVKTLLEVPQPYGNHNGGSLAFGPDKHLYIGLGDGGAGGDPHNHGQDRSTLLGSILRLNVSKPGRATIPSDNPFINQRGARPELWAYGLRNPWRFSFDRARGDLWVGDVGQNRYEEVHLIRAGDNLGWKWREGRSDYQDSYAPDHRALSEEARARLVDPIATYDHSQGVSITGGYVYRGSAKAWRGQYLYADFATGRLWALNADQARRGQAVTPRQIAQPRLNIASFAEDQRGELYALCFDGVVYQLSWR